MEQAARLLMADLPCDLWDGYPCTERWFPSILYTEHSFKQEVHSVRTKKQTTINSQLNNKHKPEIRNQKSPTS